MSDNRESGLLGFLSVFELKSIKNGMLSRRTALSSEPGSVSVSLLALAL